MASNRIGRINEEIQRELSDLIRSLKDPRVQTLISITRVDTTPDLRYSKIYISVMDEEKQKDAMRGLRSAGGWLRRELAAACSCAIRQSSFSSLTTRSSTARTCLTSYRN